MSATLRQSIVPLFLFACLLLGGSPQGIWRNLLLHLGGLALLAWALLSSRPSHPTRSGRLLLWLGGLWFVLVLFQLVHLPPALWTMLPGREPAIEGFTLRGADLPWLPLSLTPHATAAVLPLMAVPLGLIAAIVLLGAYRSRWCVATLVLGTCLSVLLGAVQLSQAGFYLYPRVNVGAASGLFANSNHQATLLLATLPFLAAMVGRQRQSRGMRHSAALGGLMIWLGAVAVILVGILLNGSLAGVGLLVPVALACLAIALPTGARTARLLALAAVLLLLAGATGLAVFSDAVSSDMSVAERSEIYRITGAAIRDTFPVGTGLGSFRAYYRLYEDPALVSSFFINHAHSDPLEWVLETGLPGLLLLGALLAWWAVRAVRIWKAEQPDLTALAATVASGAILAHSVVDYPLRDAAIQAVFALSLALMADPRSHSVARRARSQEPGQAPRHMTLDDHVPASG